MERDKTYQQVLQGERIPINQIRPQDYRAVFNGLKSERVGGQRTLPIPELDLDGGIVLFTSNPDPIPLSPEQEHLLRPVDLKKPVLPLLPHL